MYETPRDRLKQFVVPLLCRALPPLRRLFSSGISSVPTFYKEFCALRNVSFEIAKGETVGIIGRNGSGKSTLLQIICGTLSPSSGSIQTSGRIAALLELGSGFNPEFTGHENVYINAKVLGLSKGDVDARFDEIVAFADIGDFIDQPVKTYSSGMYVRLAFAVIAHVDADILIVDEALAVGDIFFQQKCMRYLRDFQARDGTVVFVSHDTSAVINLCDRAILLSRENGIVVGKADAIAQIYIQELYAERDQSVPLSGKTTATDTAANRSSLDSNGASAVTCYRSGDLPANPIRITPFRHDADCFGKGGIKIVDAWFESPGGARTYTVNGGDPVSFCIRAEARQGIDHAAFGLMIKDRLGQYVFTESTDLAYRNGPPAIGPGDVVLATFSFLMPVLISGDYSMNVAVAEGIGDDHIQHHWINDAVALHSLKGRVVFGICGLHDMSMEIRVTAAQQSEAG
ncbi:ABC transporter ATP-binding protein [Candidatus Accumulibacter aalborgensis]|nr:ABC transporter ATP-binding protein [Candidatus Accumulibacter aalborgensis]